MKGTHYIPKAHSAQTMFGLQQRTNMETNNSDNWLGVIAISNYKAMWLAHGSQVIVHMTRNNEKKETLGTGNPPQSCVTISNSF